MFTKNTYATHDYWVKGEAVSVYDKDVYIPYVCAIAAVSNINGLEHLRTYNNPVNSEIFADFIDELAVKTGFKRFALFMD
jgi:hypothetical protein